MSQEIILAYSGGLDTSVILKWLIDKGYKVISFTVDIGQDDNFIEIQNKALKIGATKVIIIDCKNEFLNEYIYPSLQTGALYEGRYLLGTSLARPLIAKKIIEYAKDNGINNVAHGATGKGNDQVRFELAFLQFMPNVNIIAPWKEIDFLTVFKGRTDLLNYANKNNIEVTSSIKKPYSIDENLMHTSYEAGILEDPAIAAPQDIYRKTLAPQEAPDKTLDLCLEFKEGILDKISEINSNKEIIKSITGDTLILFNYLNKVGKINAIGRIDIVESRFVGMKSRGIYETPAGTILHKAYQDLETIVLDREVLLIKAINAPKIAQLIYNGFWFSPELKILMSMNNVTIKLLTGCVYLSLYKGNVIINGRSSPNSLYSHDIASMDQLGDYDQTDAKGFIKLNALRLKKINNI